MSGKRYKYFYSFLDLDVVIPGNGEVPFAQLVDHLTSYQDVPNIIYRQSKYNLARNPALHQEQFATIADLPGPAYHLLSRPIDSYAHNIRTYLGCPYKCDFCIERLSWQGHKGRNSLERIIDELRFVTQGATSRTLIHFSDSIKLAGYIHVVRSHYHQGGTGHASKIRRVHP